MAITNRGLALVLIVLSSLSRLLAQAPEFTEVLGKPTANGISITCGFDTICELRAQYGLNSGIYTEQSNWQLANAHLPSEIKLINLNTSTCYFYRVQFRKPGSTTILSRPEYRFCTQASKSKAFSFIVQADPHLDEQSDTALYNLTLKNELEESPDFLIDLGDFLMTDKLKNKTTSKIPFDTIPYRCKLLRRYYEKNCHSIPLFIALGNHEGESGWNLNGTSNNIAVWGSNERKKYFPNPIPDNFYTGDTSEQAYIGKRASYYAWEWGDALFMVLDPYWYTNPKPDSLHGWRWTLGKNQYDWLKTTLETSTSTYRFVFSHQLVGGDPDGRGGVEFANYYEWGGKNLDGTDGWAQNRPGWYKPIKDLFKENKVHIFFHGHDHFFGKQEKDCLIYQETPQPSHPNFSNVNYAYSYGYKEGLILPQSGHLKVSLDTSGVRVDYVRTYLPAAENANRKNKDISATYFITKPSCYDSMTTSSPVIWNSRYASELVYPNPFSQSTRIQFEVRNNATYSLSLFNSEGQLTRTLLDHTKLDKGNYLLDWDAKDQAGMDVPEGMYMYVLKGSDGSKGSGKIYYKKD